MNRVKLSCSDEQRAELTRVNDAIEQWEGGHMDGDFMSYYDLILAMTTALELLGFRDP